VLGRAPLDEALVIVAREETVAEAARRTIAEHETLHLSERDRAAFFEAMINPPEPSERLTRAFAEQARRVGP
jgi:uncharacterized protein (DUF1778 family)